MNYVVKLEQNLAFMWIVYAHIAWSHSRLNNLKEAPLSVVANCISEGKVEVTLKKSGRKPGNFFQQDLIDKWEHRQRILTVFYDDNYVSLMSGEEQQITLVVILSH